MTPPVPQKPYYADDDKNNLGAYLLPKVINILTELKEGQANEYTEKYETSQISCSEIGL